MEIGFREKMIGACVGLLLAVVGWYMLYYQSGNAHIVQIRAEIAQLEQQIQSASATGTGIQQLQAEIDGLQNNADQLKERIPSKNRLLELTRQLERQAGRFNVTVDRIVPTKEALFTAGPAEPVTRVPIQMWLEGEFLNIGKFLESFETMPFLLHAGEVQISTEDENYPSLDVFLTAYVYVTQ